MESKGFLAATSEHKKAFALEYLKKKDGYAAGIAAFGENDVPSALLASTRWPRDVDVIKFMDDAVNMHGESAFLPNKADLCRTVWEIAEDPQRHIDDRLKAIRLYADVQGFIEKQGAVINNNILTNNKVMLVKDHGSVEEWELQMAAQQSKLIEEAHAPRVES